MSRRLQDLGADGGCDDHGTALDAVLQSDVASKTDRAEEVQPC